jgi:5-(carboxyamino)imidazole ribonucleotide synthase
LDAAQNNQFEQHVRCVLGWPVAPYEQIHAASAMANLLGDGWTRGEPRWSALAGFPQVRLHLYGKAQARPGRKMGHLTAWSESVESAEAMVRDARRALFGSTD